MDHLASGSICALALMLAAGAPVLATDGIPEIETDRPDQTETATVVPRGAIQFEGGIGYERAAEPMTIGVTAIHSTITTPDALIRYGIATGLELRFGFASGVARTRMDCDDCGQAVHVFDAERAQGDISLGTKVQLMQGEGAGPDLAAILDVAADTRELDDPVVGLRLSAAHDLPAGFGLGVNVGGFWRAADDPLVWSYTGSLGHDIAPSLGGFVELFGESAGSDGSSLSADAGLTLLRGPNVRFDLAAGLGIAGSAPDYFVNAGVSFRLVP